MINEVLDVMVELTREGMTTMVATHDTRSASKVTDRVVFMDEADIVEDRLTDAFLAIRTASGPTTSYRKSCTTDANRCLTALTVWTPECDRH